MDVYFKEIDQHNWEECVRLEVHESQAGFVAPNWYSIIQAQYHPTYVPLAIYNKEGMIGFFMYGKDPADDKYWIVRLMIDKHVQGKGFGKGALLKGIELIKQKPDCSPQIFVSFEPENAVARKLYKNVGFKETGEVNEGEIVFCLDVRYRL